MKGTLSAVSPERHDLVYSEDSWSWFGFFIQDASIFWNLLLFPWVVGAGEVEIGYESRLGGGCN